MTISRRRYLRAPIAIALNYWIDDQGPFSAFTQTLGAGGLFIETTSPGPSQSPLKLEFILPGERTRLNLEGKVVWVRDRFVGDSQPGMGVQFSGIARKDRERIDALVLKVLKGTE
jgi:uncharacterized protein (TIGR02266 family)